MAARKKTTSKAKTQYVRSKKRKGAESAVKARRVVTIALLLLVVIGCGIWAVCSGMASKREAVNKSQQATSQ